MIKTIYKLRADGDYDFVAAFETEQILDGCDWIRDICEYLYDNDEVAIVVKIPLGWRVDVLESDSLTIASALIDKNEAKP